MARDAIWGHVVVNNTGNGAFRCKYCGTIFQKGGPKRIKFHLSKLGDTCVPGCDGVPIKVREEARSALKSYGVRGDPLAVPGPSTSAQSGQTSEIQGRIVHVVQTASSMLNFVPSLASAVFYYLQGTKDVVMVGASNADVPVSATGVLASKEVKGLLSSFNHMKLLLEWRHGGQSDVHTHSEAVEMETGSSKYSQMVHFLVGNDQFWEAGELFVLVLGPLIEMLAVLSTCGATVGHVARSAETAQEKYGIFPPFHQVHVMINSFLNSSINLVSKAARSVDPSYLLSDACDLDEMGSCLMQFAALFVAANLEVEFLEEVELYLQESPLLFTPQALVGAENLHPAKFWHAFGGATPTISQYAIRLVMIKFRAVPLSFDDLKAILSDGREVEERHVSEVGLCFGSADALLGPFLQQVVMYGGGYQEVGSMLKRVGDRGWRHMVEYDYDSFAGHIEGYLKC